MPSYQFFDVLFVWKTFLVVVADFHQPGLIFTKLREQIGKLFDGKYGRRTSVISQDITFGI